MRNSNQLKQWLFILTIAALQTQSSCGLFKKMFGKKKAHTILVNTPSESPKAKPAASKAKPAASKAKPAASKAKPAVSKAKPAVSKAKN